MSDSLLSRRWVADCRSRSTSRRASPMPTRSRSPASDERTRAGGFVVLRSSHADFATGRNNPRPAPMHRRRVFADRRRFSEVIFNCYGSFRACTVPIIAASSRARHGFGCSIASLCDITFCGRYGDVSDQRDEPSHSADDGDVVAGRRIARRSDVLCASRATVSAARAQAMNIVTEVVPARRPRRGGADSLRSSRRRRARRMQGVKSISEPPTTCRSKAQSTARNLHANINSARPRCAEPAV